MGNNRHAIGASTVWINGDLRNIVESIVDQTVRAGGSGDYLRGVVDAAISIARACNVEVDIPAAVRVLPPAPTVTADDLTAAYYAGISAGASREFAAGAAWMALQIGVMIGASLPIRTKGVIHENAH